MPELNFAVESVEPERFAAAPQLVFRLSIRETTGMPIHAIALRCQIRIQPARRRYDEGEKQRLFALFGTPERWGQTVRDMLWTHVSTVVRPFTHSTTADLLVPCSHDFSLAATRYFDALGGGEIPLCFLFSGTVFYDRDDRLQVMQISWEKEATFRLSAEVWRNLLELYYPNSAWLCLRKDVFDRLSLYRSGRGLPSWEQALEELLATEEAVP